jgi:hypothetical protein
MISAVIVYATSDFTAYYFLAISLGAVLFWPPAILAP